jgi:hypothetical protein
MNETASPAKEAEQKNSAANAMHGNLGNRIDNRRGLEFVASLGVGVAIPSVYRRQSLE